MLDKVASGEGLSRVPTPYNLALREHKIQMGKNSHNNDLSFVVLLIFINAQTFKFLIKVFKGEKTSFSVQNGVSIIF